MSDTGPLGLSDITCPACLGEGKRLVDSGGGERELYTCESCRGVGLLHPKRAEEIRRRLKDE
jgi:DnaJ-class molecular chaperone